MLQSESQLGYLRDMTEYDMNITVTVTLKLIASLDLFVM